MLQLSSVHPDYESLLSQLQLYLRQKSTWLDTVDSGAGETLLEAVAAIGEFNQLGIELAYREAFLETANRKSSVYAITRMLGVRINRKSPSSVVTVLTRSPLTTSYTLKSYTQFDIAGTLFFNRQPIVFPANADQVECTLYQGEVKTLSVDSTAAQFREIYIPESDFNVSDFDVVVDVVNPSLGTTERWDNTYEGIWAADAGDKVFYDTTSANGSAIVMLGDGTHGALPPIGTEIQITYVLTKGSEGNNGVMPLPVKSINTSEILAGSTQSPIVGGDDNKSYTYYKRQAPYIYRAKKRAVIANDYSAITLDYPNVASVVVHAQRDIAPSDLRWMNLIRICILPKDTDSFNSSQWDDYETYLRRFNHFGFDIQRYNPTKIECDIYCKIAMKPNQVDSVVKNECAKKIQALFAKENTIGKRKSISDISNACRSTGKVDYVIVVTPTTDLVCPTPYSWYSLRNLTMDVFYTER